MILLFTVSSVSAKAIASAQFSEPEESIKYLDKLIEVRIHTFRIHIYVLRRL